MKRFILGLSLIVFCMLYAGVQAETVYRWVDDEGTTHFTRHPPKNRKATPITTKTGRSDPVDYSNPGKNSQAKTNAEAQNSSASTEQSRPDPGKSPDHQAACRSARRNLEILSQGRRVRVENEQGELRFLDAQEQEQRRELAKRNIAKHCS